MEFKTITYQSSKIVYRIIGEGKPVVFVHGFGEDGDIWQEQIDFLKDQFQLIIPDLPGSGQSEMINDMSIEGMAEVLKAILDNESLTEEVYLFGHSMGGYITLAFAEKYPSLLAAFGLIHSSAFADSEEKKNTREKAIGFINNNGAYEFLKTSIPDLFYRGHDGPKLLESINELIEKGKNFTPEALIAYYRAMINRPGRTAVLKTFSKPILFIIGQFDKAIPFQQSLQQCYLPSQPHVHILRLSAHMGMIEESDKVNNALLKFLQEAIS